jgi:hypothetical protein
MCVPPLLVCVHIKPRVCIEKREAFLFALCRYRLRRSELRLSERLRCGS